MAKESLFGPEVGCADAMVVHTRVRNVVEEARTMAETTGRQLMATQDRRMLEIDEAETPKSTSDVA